MEPPRIGRNSSVPSPEAASTGPESFRQNGAVTGSHASFLASLRTMYDGLLRMQDALQVMHRAIASHEQWPEQAEGDRKALTRAQEAQAEANAAFDRAVREAIKHGTSLETIAAAVGVAPDVISHRLDEHGEA